MNKEDIKTYDIEYINNKYRGKDENLLIEMISTKLGN